MPIENSVISKRLCALVVLFKPVVLSYCRQAYFKFTFRITLSIHVWSRVNLILSLSIFNQGHFLPFNKSVSHSVTNYIVCPYQQVCLRLSIVQDSREPIVRTSWHEPVVDVNGLTGDWGIPIIRTSWYEQVADTARQPQFAIQFV